MLNSVRFGAPESRAAFRAYEMITIDKPMSEDSFKNRLENIQKGIEHGKYDIDVETPDWIVGKAKPGTDLEVDRFIIEKKNAEPDSIRLQKDFGNGKRITSIMTPQTNVEKLWLKELYKTFVDKSKVNPDEVYLSNCSGRGLLSH